MKNLSHHGKDLEQAIWVLEYFGTPEKREYYKDNKSFKLWMDDCAQLVREYKLNF